MKKGKNEKQSQKDKLRLENEMLKKKLSAEKGAKFSNTDESKISSELENEFLKNIGAFHSAHDNAEQIAIFDFIGKPEYKKCDSIPDDEISEALENILEVLNDSQINIDTLCDVDDRTLYSFITDELFKHEIDNARLEGMFTNFIYEEFHPNHEYDLENHSRDFMKTFIKKQTEYFSHNLTKEAEEDKYLLNFNNSFESFQLNKFEITSINFDEAEGKAKVEFLIDFTGIIENSTETQQWKGKGSFDFVNVYDYWCINKVNFPDVK